jgi:hypothetical protein
MVLITVAYVSSRRWWPDWPRTPARAWPPSSARSSPAPHRLRHHRLRHRQHRPHGHRVRGHRHGVRALQRVALPVGPHRRGGHLVARALRLLPLRRAHLPAADRGLHRLPHRRRPGHPNWHQVAVNTVWPHFEASKSFLLLAVALIGTTITPYIQLYEAGAVVDKGVKPETTTSSGSTPSPAPSSPPLVAMSIIVATGATIGGTGPLTSAAHRGRGPQAGRRRRRPRRCSASGCSEPPPWPPPWCRCRPPTRWPRRSGSSGRCRRASARPPCSSASSPPRSSWAPRWCSSPGNLITLILNTQVLEGVITPMTLVLILVLANRRSLLGRRPTGRWARWLGGSPSSRSPPWPASSWS